MIITDDIFVTVMPKGCVECNFCIYSTEADRAAGCSDWICVAGKKGKPGLMDLECIDVVSERPKWCILKEAVWIYALPQ